MTKGPVYTLREEVHVDTSVGNGERFEATFPKGKVSAKSEQEEQALSQLVSMGFATSSATPEEAES